MTQNIEATARMGVEAFRNGDTLTARRAFEAVAEGGRATAQLYMMLARCCGAENDIPAAHAALDKVLEAEPLNPFALSLRGDLFGAVGDNRAAVSWYATAIRSIPDPAPTRETAEIVEHCRRRMSVAQQDFQFHLSKDLADAGINAEAAGSRFGEAMQILAGEKTIYLQQPSSFYYPRLPHIQFYEREMFPWLAEVEAAVPAMQAELAAVLADGQGLEPHLQSNETRYERDHPLTDNPDWSSYDFYKEGVLIEEHAERCPATMAALEKAPLFKVPGRSPMALFSVLKPGTLIPPHNGLLNTRLICHIPLVIPGPGGLRVGNETRSWEVGKALIFDDSIEHEAWNDSDKVRTVLLFDIWRPEITEEERKALTILLSSVVNYGGRAA
jgi:aspartyl/asparaginyl beta-hydroxylase (cupin superfamily)